MNFNSLNSSDIYVGILSAEIQKIPIKPKIVPNVNAEFGFRPNAFAQKPFSDGRMGGHKNGIVGGGQRDDQGRQKGQSEKRDDDKMIRLGIRSGSEFENETNFGI